MNVITRLVNQLNQVLFSLVSKHDHVHLARAYRPVSSRMFPRWRLLGRAITPYHFMQVVPVIEQRKLEQSDRK